jgi:hypothetical protein
MKPHQSSEIVTNKWRNLQTHRRPEAGMTHGGEQADAIMGCTKADPYS